MLQEHLFDHLWLLDPSWERATGSEQIEENLRKIAPGLFAKDKLDKEITGRIDIRYKTVGGRHVIVELKRYGVKVDARKLAEQGAKYAAALASLLSQQQRDHEIPFIEVVFVLGQRPGSSGWVQGIKSTEDEYFHSQFESFNGSYRLYDAVSQSAQTQYQEYLEASSQARKLDDLLSTLSPDAVAEEEEKTDTVSDGGADPEAASEPSASGIAT